MNPKVLLVGAGQLGSRHLQGLARCLRPLDILVCDPSRDALARADVRWREVVPAPDTRVHFSPSLPDDGAPFDLAIIATAAAGRAELLAGLVQRCDVKAWIIEKVLAQSEEELDALSTALGDGLAWVNTPRRMMRWYREIREATGERQPTAATVTGGKWGLACSAIHFIDLLAWWTGESVTEVGTTALDRWYESKRPGYWEIDGTLTVNFSAGSTLVLTAGPTPMPITLCLQSSGGVWTVVESTGTAFHSDGRMVRGRMEFQSELTGRLADEILQSNRCELPTLPDSVSLHRPFVRALSHHWNTHVAPSRRLPIT